MVDQQSSATGSESFEPDPVVEARRWLSQRGLPAPVAEPVLAAPPKRTAGPVRDKPAPSANALMSVTADVQQDDGYGGSQRRGRAERGVDRQKGDDRRSRRAGSVVPGPPENPEETARDVVLRKLTGQSRSRHELNQALKAKQVPESVADQVLDRMEEVGLIDDAAFARDWVESRQQRRQLSRRALRHELQTKGVDREQIENALATVDGDDELVAALALAERKLRGMSGLTREVQYRRLAGALARRGFSGGVTGQVMSQVLDGLDR